MRKKIYLLYCFFLLILFQGVSQNIYWNSGYRLKWCDYIKLEKHNSEFAALTYTQIEVKSESIDGLPNYLIRSKFVSDSSWISAYSLSADSLSSLLIHEQLHFDISELFARKMQKSMDSLRSLKVNDDDIYQKVINRWFYEAMLAQSNYDRQTFHGVMDTKQKEWNEDINKKLKLFKSYSRCE